MSTILQFSLIAHVIFGLIGVIAFYAVLLGILKQVPSLRFLRFSSIVGFLSILVAWVMGGYYYVMYYGSTVKPVIKEGDFSWAHLIFMETKEHVFLMLPFISFILVLIFLLIGERIFVDTRLKSSIALLAAVATVIATFIALAGIIVSGGAR